MPFAAIGLLAVLIFVGLSSPEQISANIPLFLFAMFATGRATLPADGMRAIPRQLAAALPAGTVRTGAKVRLARPGRVELADGEVLAPRAVIIATDARALALLVPGTRVPGWNGCVTLYWAAERSPVAEPVLVLEGNARGGPVSHLCVPSDVAPAYAPAGAALVSATMVGACSWPSCTSTVVAVTGVVTVAVSADCLVIGPEPSVALTVPPRMV